MTHSLIMGLDKLTDLPKDVTRNEDEKTSLSILETRSSFFLYFGTAPGGISLCGGDFLVQFLSRSYYYEKGAIIKKKITTIWIIYIKQPEHFVK